MQERGTTHPICGYPAYIRELCVLCNPDSAIVSVYHRISKNKIRLRQFFFLFLITTKNTK
jgi:hypothetical protein